LLADLFKVKSNDFPQDCKCRETYLASVQIIPSPIWLIIVFVSGTNLLHMILPRLGMIKPGRRLTIL
jgi:hypothetical protein